LGWQRKRGGVWGRRGRASWLGFGKKWCRLIYASELGPVGTVRLLGLVPPHVSRRAV
jgi:hypothetical protein